ncbi:GSCOCT00013093001.2-RA-CDS [Cotesia congregata]|uniref:Cc_bv23.1_32.20 n=1 Tax=Cotesia congregata TaxID=51543 RepID=S6D2Z1_COTCN|nr:GSCOCT00013093001.2-RA-CDS [Cotesia congregata]CAG5092529.1 cc_bv23.1_32.20 [Cotesia congregata]CCQ71251.1 hypothetical protein BV23-1 [Cotesia congregata]
MLFQYFDRKLSRFYIIQCPDFVFLSKGRIMSEKKSCQKPIIEENKRKVCEQAKVAKPSRTLEKLEEARKIVTDLQEEQKPDTDFKANLTGQNQKLIAFRRITGNKTRLFK